MLLIVFTFFIEKVITEFQYNNWKLLFLITHIITSPAAENTWKYPELWVTGNELQIVNAKKKKKNLLICYLNTGLFIYFEITHLPMFIERKIIKYRKEKSKNNLNTQI